MSLVLTPLTHVPLIHPGDHLAEIILSSVDKEEITLQDGDILVVTQKIISKAENRFVNLKDVKPSQKAQEIAFTCQKDPRLVEVILNESKSVVRCGKDTLIVEHRLGFICANAGVDHSNVKGDQAAGGIWYLLLPNNPDQSAQTIRDEIKRIRNVDVGVMVIDSHGRAWRQGIVGIMIGTAGVPAVVDMRGKKDLFGYALKITKVGAADELAAAASLVMGQAAECAPVVHVRGFPYELRKSSLKEVLRPKTKDLFR
jgi:coenzyme F420-0:L-glutamate ligase/coenzyme F420-1:gamma-L-glutamate ligase